MKSIIFLLSTLFLLPSCDLSNPTLHNNKVKWDKKVRTPEMKNVRQATNAQMYEQASEFPNVWTCLEPKAQKAIYLTFDDGPSKYTPELLDTLDALGIKATFFMVGKQAETYPEYAKMVSGKGHSIGNHTYDHTYLKGMQPAELVDQIQTTEAVFNELELNHTSSMLRIPWGNISGDQIKSLGEGYQIMHWSINTDDWKFNKETNGVDSIYQRIINYAHPGAIILAHDGGGNRKKTIQAVSKAVRYLTKRGYQFDALK